MITTTTVGYSNIIAAMTPEYCDGLGPKSSFFRLGVIEVAIAMLLLAACSPGETPQTPAAPKRSFVGSEACANCHSDAFARWRESHHAKAMQNVSDESVLGDFDGAVFRSSHEQFRFVREGSRFTVEVTGADAPVPARSVISHTFGVSPLQQYLIERSDGRRQSLTVAWDSRPAAEGGSRWYSLYSDDEPAPGTALHWTGLYQNWNFMCADCHSTGLRKKYDSETNRFATSWAELSVGCEACHGPGSAHVDLMAASSAADRADIGDARLALLDTSERQVEVCAQCHSRRQQIAEGFQAGDSYFDFYVPALLESGLYHADGQIDDEVYVYGSFVQSKMFQRGVRCSDCHEPHSAVLARTGNAVCTHCHSENPAVKFPTLGAKDYDTPAHHFHTTESPGVQCVDCHMSGKNYMGHDFRRDHSFRVPRPDIVNVTGAPDACTACHRDKTSEWAAAEITARYGAGQAAHFGTVFAAARDGERAAETELVRIAQSPAEVGLVRGSALSLLAAYSSVGAREAIVAGLASTDPLQRLGALRATPGMDARTLWRYVAPLLDDPLLGVRLAATQAMARVYADEGTSVQRRDKLEVAIEEWLTASELNADRPETYLQRGTVYRQMGDYAAAEAAFDSALRIDARSAVARLALADLYRVSGRDAVAGTLYSEALDLASDDPAVYRAYAFWLVRQGRHDAAMEPLRAAAALTPDEPDNTYLFAVALNSNGDRDLAIATLQDLRRRFPNHEQTLYALSTMSRDAGDMLAARKFAAELLTLAPQERQYLELQQNLARE